MGYKILIKASGSSTAEVFKFYKEPGVAIDYEVDTIEELKPTYVELINKYPASQVFPIHNLTVNLDPEIEDHGGDEPEPDPDKRIITGISASISENKIVTFTAEGENLSETELYNWTVLCDSSTKYLLTSTGPIVSLNEVQSSSYIDALTVTISVKIGSEDKWFTIK